MIYWWEKSEGSIVVIRGSRRMMARKERIEIYV